MDIQQLGHSRVGQNNKTYRMDLPHHAKLKTRGGENRGIDTLLANKEDRRRDLRPNFLTDVPTPLNQHQQDTLDRRRDARNLRIQAKPGELSERRPQEITEPETLDQMAQRLLKSWG